MKVTKITVTGERADKILQVLTDYAIVTPWNPLIRGLIKDYGYRCVLEIKIHLRK